MVQEEERNVITIDQVREEVACFFKKIVKAEYCPHCKEIQNMQIVYHFDELRGFPPKVIENLRCPGCLKLFAPKLEEVNKDDKEEKKNIVGFGTKNRTVPKIEENKVKKEEEKTVDA